MKRRSRAGGEPIKGRRRKTLEPERVNAPKGQARSKLSLAIEGTEVARLTRELTDERRQRWATSEVLRLLSGSHSDLNHLFDTILANATTLCQANFGTLSLCEGDAFRIVAMHNVPPGLAELRRREPLVRAGPLLRMAETKRLLHIVDYTEYLASHPADSDAAAFAKLTGVRTTLEVPMLKDDDVIGAIVIYRTEVRRFDDRPIALIKDFAAQAVIAIENARLLNELRQRTIDLTARTADLTEALKQQTATSEVLQVISGSPGDLQPVFATILENAVRICDAKFGNIYRRDGEALHLLATHNTPPAYAEERRRSPYRPYPHSPIGRMMTDKTLAHISDITADQVYIAKLDPVAVSAVALGGTRTILGVPLLNKGEMIGTFFLSRQEVRPFTEKQIELVQNFAAQAVIAIENARLLNELRERTEEVEKLNQHLEQRVADQVGEIERMSRLRRFLPPQVADLIVASGSERQLESHRREITALFCDLRGFTWFTESADAEDVIALLRDYHAAIGEIIIKYNGTLERYAGDGVMVVFNDPVPEENPALQAVLMALEVRDAIGALTETWRRWGHDIGFGIGIAHGFATLGTIGFEGRFDYAAIGTVSNVASRLCDEAKPGQILISPRVLTKVENAIQVEQVGEFELKGIRRPLAAYNVLAAKSTN
jgi:class 3 adenylate cyclase